MRRILPIVFSVLFLSFSVAHPADAQVTDLQILNAEREIERVCEKIDETAFSQSEIVRTSVEKWRDTDDTVLKVQSHVLRTGRALRSQGRLSADELESLLIGGLASHPDPQVQGLIDLMAQMTAFSEGVAREKAEIEALIGRLGLEIARLRQRKENLKRDLETLKNSRPSPSIVGSGEGEDDAEIDEFMRIVSQLAAIGTELDTVDRAIIDAMLALENETLPQLEFPTPIRERTAIATALTNPPEALIVDEPPGSLSDEAADELETTIRTLSDPDPRIFLTLGLTNEPDLTFPAFGQGLLTSENWFASAGILVPIGREPLAGYSGYWTGEYSRIEMTHQNHINIATGVPGPSAGSAVFHYVGAGLAIERPLGHSARLGLGAGIGGLVHDVSGSFRASGTTGAAKLDMYLLYDLAARMSGGPYVSAVFPFGDVSGGAGVLTSRFEADPLFLFGFRFDLGLGR